MRARLRILALGASLAASTACHDDRSDPSPPGTPPGFAVAPGDGQATSTWGPAAGADSYNLYWSTSPGVTTAGGTKIAGVVSPHAHTGLTNGTAYYYILTAQNAAGEGVPTGEVSVVPSATPAPPPGFGVVSGNGQATASWNASAGAASYNLYWSTAPGVTTSTGTKVAGVASPYVQAGLTNGTRYYFILTAENASGESAPTGEVSVIPPPALAPDFSLQDVNPNSPTATQMVSPRDSLANVPAFYFGHAT